jgi:hypothetical protein
MKRYFYFLFLLPFLITGCGEGEKADLPEGTHKVEVIESMNASSYTYMRVEEDGNEFWIAAPQMNVNNGDVYYFSKSLEMQNFSSATLNRTFDKILFVEDIRKTPDMGTAPQGGMNQGMNPHSQVMSGKKDVKIDPLKDGQTVETLYKNKESLSGNTIKIKGVVTKYNPGIMDRNWVHIQDGTGFNDNYDLIVTSTDSVDEGKIIVVEGTVSLNRDFGNGYAYELLIENAKLKSE